MQWFGQKKEQRTFEAKLVRYSFSSHFLLTYRSMLASLFLYLRSLTPHGCKIAGYSSYQNGKTYFAGPDQACWPLLCLASLVYPRLLKKEKKKQTNKPPNKSLTFAKKILPVGKLFKPHNKSLDLPAILISPAGPSFFVSTRKVIISPSLAIGMPPLSPPGSEEGAPKKNLFHELKFINPYTSIYYPKYSLSL